MTDPLTPAELAEICATTDYAERGRYGFPRLLREVERLRAELAEECERVQGLADTAMTARFELERDGDEMDAMRAVVDAAVEWYANPSALGPLSKAVNTYLAAKEARDAKND